MLLIHLSNYAIRQNFDKMINPEIIELIQSRLSLTITGTKPVSGGDINAVYCLQTGTGGKLLLKLNSARRFPNMFKYEQEGLLAIANSNTIKAPSTILQEEFGNDSFLLMEWIDSMRPTPASLHNLGTQLARMHQNSSSTFGWDTPNYIGSLPQSNNRHTTWATFFIQERLQPMVKLAFDNGRLTVKDLNNFEVLENRLPQLFDEGTPSLLHGDLWSGNYLIDTDEQPCLIDPAIYYGHREMDIALTTLFGGFGPSFYEAYQQSFPLNKGWEQRMDLWNLYPLLVHVNLFGGGYMQQTRNNLSKYL